MLHKISKKGKLQCNEITKQLIEDDLVRETYSGIDRYGQFIPTGFCETTDNGKRYLIYLHNQFWKLIFNSIVIPLLIALITSLIYNKLVN